MTWQEIVSSSFILALLATLGTTWKRVYDQAVKDRDFWRDMALKNMSLAEKSATVAEKAVDRAISHG